MRNGSSIAFIALLASCGGTAPGDEGRAGDALDDGTDPDVQVEPCDAGVVSFDPEPDSDAAPLDAVVTVAFDVAVPTTGHYALSVDGVTGTTTLAPDGLSMSFTPGAPLAHGTTYTVHAEVCDDVVSASFTTVPPPIAIEDLAGHTYALPWDTLHITEPKEGATIRALMPFDFVLLQIVSVDPGTLEAPAAVAVAMEDASAAPVPDCSTVVEEVADFSMNPLIRFTGDLQITVDPDATPPRVADIEDFELQAVVSDEGASITQVELRALVAPEQFFPGATCASVIIQAMQPTCEPCTTSTSGECMVLAGTAPLAEVVPDLDLVTSCGS